MMLTFYLFLKNVTDPRFRKIMTLSIAMFFVNIFSIGIAFMYTYYSSHNKDVSCILFVTKFSSISAYCYIYIFMIPSFISYSFISLKIFNIAKTQAQQIQQQIQMEPTNKKTFSVNILRYFIIMTYLIITHIVQIVVIHLAVFSPDLTSGETINIILIILILLASNRGIITFLSMKTLRQSFVHNLKQYDCVTCVT